MKLGSVSDSSVNAISRRERDRRRRREDIFRAAEKVFAEKGFHAASMEEIARAAEYGTGTVYLYFEDKETLYVELCEEKFRELFEFLKARADDAKDPLSALHEAIRARMEYFDRNRAFYQIYAGERTDPAWSKSRRWEGVNKLYDGYIDFLTRLVRAGQRSGVIRKGDARHIAIALSGMMRQLTRDWLQHESDGSLTDTSDFVTELFLRGAEQK